MTNPIPNGHHGWRDFAACGPGDSWLFHNPFEEGHEPHSFRIERIRLAKRICAICPVRSACLEAALLEGDSWAIRGGTTPAERGHRRSGRTGTESAA